MLRDGQVVEQGAVQIVIESYFRDLGVLGADDNSGEASSSSRSIFGRVKLNDGSTNSISQSEPLTFSTTISIPRHVSGFRMLVLFHDMRSQQLIGLEKRSEELGLGELQPGEYEISAQTPALWLTPGMYSVFFKLYLEGESESAKHLSDPFPLDIHGDRSTVDAILSPPSDWTFHAMNETSLCGPGTDRSIDVS